MQSTMHRAAGRIHFYTLQSMFALLSILVGIISFGRFTISTSILFSCLLFIVCNLLFISYINTTNGIANLQALIPVLTKQAAVSLASGIFFAILFEALTVIGSLDGNLTDFQSWSKKRLLVYFVCGLFIAHFIVLKIMNKKGSDSLSTSFIKLKTMLAEPKVVAIAIFFLLLFAGIALLVNPLFALTLTHRQVIVLALFLLMASFLTCFLHKIAPYRTERFFLLYALLIGTYLSFSLPPVTGISPDDQIHYDRSLTVSYVWNPQYTDVEHMLLSLPWIPDGTLQLDSVLAYASSMNDQYDSMINAGAITHVQGPTIHVPGGDTSPSIAYLGYLPSATGLWVSRLFGASLSLQIMIGRWFNLLFYSIVVFSAIKLLPRYKNIACLIGLLPTSLYVASNFSYDPWVTSLMALSIALVLNEAEAKDRPLTAKRLLLITLLFFLALAPKAIYFPMIGMLFLLPKSKFQNKREYASFLSFTILFALFMVLTFILPMLFSSQVQTGDIRGGADVNSVDQIKYVLTHPIEYLKTLIGFILSYLSPVASNEYTMHYAYLGNLHEALPFMSAIPFVLLVATAIREPLDVDGNVPTIAARLWILALAVSCVALVATSMYVAFTPVGSNSIAGCQARYILPVALPLFTGFANAPRKSTAESIHPYWIISLISVLCITTFIIGWQQL